MSYGIVPWRTSTRNTILCTIQENPMKKYLFHVALTFVFLCCFALICEASPGDGLTCPPGWSINQSNNRDLVKQCISPDRNAFIELYAAAGGNVPLPRLMEMWARQMAQKGLPFQQQLSQITGQVSGFPALVRQYRGKLNGVTFDSSIVVCHRDGTNYVFQAIYKYGDSLLKKQARHSMNTWYFADIGSRNTAPHTAQQGGSPYGQPSGNANHSPRSFPVPTSIKVEKTGSGCDALLKIYDNFGNHIMDFQSTYAGKSPFNNEHVGWNWQTKQHQNFFKTTVTNYSDAKIQFTRCYRYGYRQLQNWCRKADGKERKCGKFKVGYITFSDTGSTALRVGTRYTNTLPPGARSVGQSGYFFKDNDYRGKINTVQIYFKYKGKEFSFKYCWKFR